MGQDTIINASETDISVNSGTLPNVNDVITEWFQQITLKVLTKSIENFRNVETVTEYSFMGVWQPASEESLAIKPPGERSWKYFHLHSDPVLQLKTDDVVAYQGEQFRVINRMDYSKYGYMRYELVKDYTGSGP